MKGRNPEIWSDHFLQPISRANRVPVGTVYAHFLGSSCAPTVTVLPPLASFFFFGFFCWGLCLAMYINIKGRGVSGGKSETNIWTGLFSPLISRSSHINSILLATNQHPSHFSDCLPKLHTTQYIIKKKPTCQKSHQKEIARTPSPYLPINTISHQPKK